MCRVPTQSWKYVGYFFSSCNQWTPPAEALGCCNHTSQAVASMHVCMLTGWHAKKVWYISQMLMLTANTFTITLLVNAWRITRTKMLARNVKRLKMEISGLNAPDANNGFTRAVLAELWKKQKMINILCAPNFCKTPQLCLSWNHWPVFLQSFTPWIQHENACTNTTC